MPRLWVIGLTAMLVWVGVWALAGSALASARMETSFMDDNQLIYAKPDRVMQELNQIAGLGVDRVKVSVVWSLVAPNASSSRRPSFDATDPAAYPPGAWDRYDRIVLAARQLGMSVYFQLDPPVPNWAIPSGQSSTQGERLGHAPDGPNFQRFVQAVGTRYSGNYRGLPRVNYWGVWNEANFPGWLNPLHTKLPHGGTELLEPPLYRRILNAAWGGLQASGHTPAARDTILIGETAYSGVQPPADFVRSLYCVGPGLGPLTGSAATRFGCPTGGSRASFVATNPALFNATGFAHHPYSFNEPPDRPYALPSWITMYNLGSLERLLNGVFASYRKLPSGGVPLYLTEFGYESNPPNPFVRNSTAQQASWINEAEYMAYRDPHVRAFNQFELIDSRPRPGTKPGTRAYWGTFQTGLEFVGGKPKPALAAFRLPIWLPVARHGNSVTVWGQLRPANHSGTQTGVIEYLARGSKSWTHAPGDVVSTNSGEGYFLTRVPIPSAGYVRLAWTDPVSGKTYYSRTVGVS
jgi:hypothetical protein